MKLVKEWQEWITPQWPNHIKAVYGEQEYLYMFYNPVTDLYKIGITNDPYIRLRKLSNGCGVELINVCEIWFEPEYDEHPRIVEGWIMEKLKSKREKGEWFKFNKRDLVELRALAWGIEADVIPRWLELKP